MTASLVGIALMFADAFGSGGALSGNLLACGVPLAFGANVILLRKMGASVDMVPTVLLGWADCDSDRIADGLATHCLMA